MKKMVIGIKILIILAVVTVVSLIVCINMNDYRGAKKTHLGNYSDPNSAYYVSISRIGDGDLVNYGETDEIAIIDQSEQVHAVFNVHSNKSPATANDYVVLWEDDGILIRGTNETYGVFVQNIYLENRTLLANDISLIKMLLKDFVAVVIAVILVLMLFSRKNRIVLGVFSVITITLYIYMNFALQGYWDIGEFKVVQSQNATYSYNVWIEKNSKLPFRDKTEYVGTTLWSGEQALSNNKEATVTTLVNGSVEHSQIEVMVDNGNVQVSILGAENFCYFLIGFNNG